MIPLLIHRIWIGGPIPSEFAANGERWADLHPGYRLWDWQDMSRLPPLRNQRLVDRAEQIYPDDWKRFTADLVRLELLWHHGGLYVDTDAEPQRHIGPLIEGRSCVVGRSPKHLRGHHPITNGVIAVEPAHPFIGALIDGIPDAVERYGYLPLARSVGPWHVTRIYESGDWPDVTVLDSETLYGGHWMVHTWNTAALRRGGGVR